MEIWLGSSKGKGNKAGQQQQSWGKARKKSEWTHGSRKIYNYHS